MLRACLALSVPVCLALAACGAKQEPPGPSSGPEYYAGHPDAISTGSLVFEEERFRDFGKPFQWSTRVELRLDAEDLRWTRSASEDGGEPVSTHGEMEHKEGADLLARCLGILSRSGWFGLSKPESSADVHMLEGRRLALDVAVQGEAGDFAVRRDSPPGPADERGRAGREGAFDQVDGLLRGR